MSNFHPIDLHQLSINPFQAIADQWMLITAEKPVDGQPKANTMTASWGGLGHLWGKDVAFAFIRPQRYTKQFVDENDCFSLCFFGGEQMEALRYLGTASGRMRQDCQIRSDPDPHRLGSLLEEASLVLLCRKLYVQTLEPEQFTDRAVADSCYPNHDFHDLYIAEVQKALVR